MADNKINIASLNVLLAHIHSGKYSETFIHDLIARLQEKSNSLVEVFGGNFPTVCRTPGTQKEMAYVTKRAIMLDKIFSLLLSKDVNFFKNRKLRHLLKKLNINFVIAEYGPVGASIYQVCDKLGIPYIVHFHAYDIYKNSERNKFINHYKNFFKTAKGIISVSDDLTETLVKHGCPREKILLNPCGVDINYFSGSRPEKTKEQFVFVGRFVMKKAPHLLVLSFAKVLEKHPNAKLIMIGDADNSDLFVITKDIINAMGLQEKIELAGSKGRDEIKQIMLGSRALVQHYVTAPDGDKEGSPVVVIEASSLGVPVISTNHTGVTLSVIHEETGFLVDEKDISGMAENICKLIEDPELAKKMGEKARKHIEKNYNQNQYVDVIIDLIES